MRKIIICFSLILLLSSGTFAQSIYQDSLRTSFSFATSVSKVQDYRSLGYGGVLSFKKGIDVGLLRTNYAELDSPDDRGKINGTGWGGFISLLAANELKGAPLGIEIGFIFSQQSYSGTTDIYTANPKPYKLESVSYGFGLNFSKRIFSGNKGFVTPNLSYNFFPVNQLREKEGTITDYAAYKYSNISFVLGLAKKKDTFVFILEPGISFNTIPQVFYGSLGLVFYSR